MSISRAPLLTGPRTAVVAPTTVLLALVLVICARPARAQELESPRPRQGYYFSGGVSGGGFKIWDDDDPLKLQPGYKFNARVGELLTRRFGLGLNLEIARSKRKTVSNLMVGLGFEGQLELVSNLALRVGVGFAFSQIDDKAVVDQYQHGAYGALYGIGLSYDWFPFATSGRTGGWALTPVIQVRLLPESAATVLAGFVGFEINYWTGLPRHMLILPESEAYQKK